MKVAMFVLGGLLAFCMSGCGPTEIQNGTSNLYKYEDKENGVICYRMNVTDGISCVKVK